jgi:DNA polymerase-3 subunit delta
VTAPVIVIKGSDDALVADALRVTLDRLRADGVDVEEPTDEELTGQAVVEHANAISLFGGDRAVVVRQPAGFRDEDWARIIEYLGDPNPSTTLVLLVARPPNKLAAAARKAGQLVETDVDGRQRKGWLQDRLAGAPVRFDRAAADRLAQHLGEDVGRLPGILDVLAAIHGDGARIGAADLDPVLGVAGASAPWDLTDAIDRGDTAGALAHLHRLVDGGRHPLVVMAGLHRHYTQLLRLDGAGIRSESEAAALLGLTGSTFPAKKAVQTAARLGSAPIARAIALLADADLDLRGVKDWPDQLVLEVLVARLSKLSRHQRV